MFNSKQQKLFETGQKKTTSDSAFITTGLKKSAETKSGNGSLKYSTTGNPFVDQFGKIGSYKERRSYQDISNDMSTLWAKNPYLTVCFVFFIRMITRIVSLFNGNKTNSVQRGSGLKYEGIMRMIWLHTNYPDIFWKNIQLFISVGSWKDIITMLSYDLQYNGWNNRVLNWDNFGKLILAGLENPNSVNLIKKYLPQIKTNFKCTTLESQADNIIAKWICSLLFGGKKESYVNYKSYRKLKSSGTAHQWQQLISKGKHNLIDFDTIHGRALSLIVSSKYLANQGLENKYEEWISNKPIAKFTGFVYELASKISYDNKKYQKDTINAQYRQLLEIAGKTNSNMIVVKDTSESMNSNAIGIKMSSYKIAKSISIFLGNMLQGHFHNHYIDFSSKAILRKIEGSNFVEHWNTEVRTSSADTNFLAVCNLFINILKEGVPENQFPNGIICISDGQFNQSKWNYSTITEGFKYNMLNAGFSKDFVDNFKFVFWDIRNEFYGNRFKDTKFESYGPAKNVFYFGGFDPSVITFLTGIEGKENTKTPTTAEELFEAAMNQEIMKLIQI